MRIIWLSSAVLLSAFNLTFASTNSGNSRIAQRTSLTTNPHFAEPLVATASTSEPEDSSLRQALEAYARRSSPKDLSMLESYVRQHPGSGWNISLETNLGLLDFHLATSLGRSGNGTQPGARGKILRSRVRRRWWTARLQSWLP